MTEPGQTQTHSGSTAAKLLLILFLGILLVAGGYFGYQLHQLSDQQKEIKEDYANVNNIELGLFSVKNWRDQVAHIVDHHVRNFAMTPAQKKELQLEIQEIMLALIDKAEAIVNKPQTSAGGKIKQFAVKKLINVDKIKAQIPGFAKTIMAKVDNPDNKNKLSNLAGVTVIAIYEVKVPGSNFTPYLSLYVGRIIKHCVFGNKIACLSQ